MSYNRTYETTAITLKMIIDGGILKANSEVVSNSRSTIATLKEDGSLSIDWLGEEKNFPYPSGAARFIEKRSLNGWLYWLIEENGTYHNLHYYRQKYLASKQ